MLFSTDIDVNGDTEKLVVIACRGMLDRKEMWPAGSLPRHDSKVWKSVIRRLHPDR